MINNEELKRILETIDAFKLISLKAEEEKKEFARYAFIWGFVMFLTFIIYGFKLTFFGKIPWLYIFIIGAFLSTLKISNLYISLLTWGITGTVLTIVYSITNNFFIFQILFVILVMTSYFLNYMYNEKFKKKKDYLPLKLSISSKIGISWAIITFGMGFVLISLIKILTKYNLPIDYIFIFILLFGFITSVGIFISGVIINYFFLIGLIGIFGIPILSLINTNLGILISSSVSLSTSIYGAYIYFKKESNKKWK